jgi:hypothetical protein
VPYLGYAHPSRRFSIISAAADAGISGYFEIPPSTLATGLDALAQQIVAPLDNFRVYYLAGSGHVWLDHDFAWAISHGVPLQRFVGEQVTGMSPWTSVAP